MTEITHTTDTYAIMTRADAWESFYQMASDKHPDLLSSKLCELADMAMSTGSLPDPEVLSDGERSG